MQDYFNQLIKNAESICFNQPLDAIKILNEALQIAHNESDDNKLALSYFHLGSCYHNIGNHSKALELFNKSLECEFAKTDKKFRAELTRCIGVQYLKLSDIDKSLQYFFESRELSEQTDYKENLFWLETTYLSLYLQMGWTEQASLHIEKIIYLSDFISGKDAKSYASLSLGAYYHLTKNYTKSIEYLKNALETTEDKFTAANSCILLTKIYSETNEYDKALTYSLRGYNLAADIPYPDLEVKHLAMTGKIYYLQGENITAISYFEKALDLIDKVENKSILWGVYKDLIEVYKKLGDHIKMVQYYEILYNTRTKHLENQLKFKIKQLNTEHEIELARRNEEIERLKNVELKNALDKVTKLNAELERINNEKNDFMAVAVHDLKNPLQNILSSARLIKSYTENKNITDISDNIIYQTERMFNLIRKLLDYNAIEMGKIRIKNTSFTGDAIIKDIANVFQPEASRKNQTIEIENNLIDSSINTDYDILYEILSNILSNAIKFTPCGKRIKIKCYTHENKIFFEVKDEGPGFKEDDFKKIFGKFSRLSAKPTNGETSTGLGLAIVKKLADLIGAEIQIRNNEGNGCTFSIVLNTEINTSKPVQQFVY